MLFNLLLTDKISIDNISNILILLIRLFNHNRIYYIILYLLIDCVYKSELPIEFFTKLIEHSKSSNPLVQIYACYIISNICQDESNSIIIIILKVDNHISIVIKEKIITTTFISLIQIQSNYIQTLIYQSIILMLSNRIIYILYY